MANYYVYMSAIFDPGPENIEKALKIYENMKASNNGYLTINVEKEGGHLRICHNDGQGEVVKHAVAFVSKCAHELTLIGQWLADWSDDSDEAYGGGVVGVDYATQVPI